MLNHQAIPSIIFAPSQLNDPQLSLDIQPEATAGVKLSYSTLTDWVSDTCKLITPLFEALKAELMQSNYLHADETPIKVLDKDKKGETHRGYY